MNRRITLGLITLAIALFGCEQEPTPQGSPNPEPEIPPKVLASSTERGLLFEHIGFDDSNPAQGRAAKLRVTNQTPTSVESVEMELIYFDDEDNKLNDFSWSHSQSPVWLDPGDNQVIAVGQNLSKSVNKVKVRVKTVE